MIKHINILNDHVLQNGESFLTVEGALQLREYLIPLLVQGHKVTMDFEGVDSVDDEVLAALFKGLTSATELTEKELQRQLTNLNLDLMTSIIARQYMACEIVSE